LTGARGTTLVRRTPLEIHSAGVVAIDELDHESSGAAAALSEASRGRSELASGKKMESILRAG
jgi:hypothetical protein